MAVIVELDFPDLPLVTMTVGDVGLAFTMVERVVPIVGGCFDVVGVIGASVIAGSESFFDVLGADDGDAVATGSTSATLDALGRGVVGLSTAVTVGLVTGLLVGFVVRFDDLLGSSWDLLDLPSLLVTIVMEIDLLDLPNMLMVVVVEPVFPDLPGL